MDIIKIILSYNCTRKISFLYFKQVKNYLFCGRKILYTEKDVIKKLNYKMHLQKINVGSNG